MQQQQKCVVTVVLDMLLLTSEIKFDIQRTVHRDIFL
jgi:hypothetical protein